MDARTGRSRIQEVIDEIFEAEKELGRQEYKYYNLMSEIEKSHEQLTTAIDNMRAAQRDFQVTCGKLFCARAKALNIEEENDQ